MRPCHRAPLAPRDGSEARTNNRRNQLTIPVAAAAPPPSAITILAAAAVTPPAVVSATADGSHSAATAAPPAIADGSHSADTDRGPGGRLLSIRREIGRAPAVPAAAAGSDNDVGSKPIGGHHQGSSRDPGAYTRPLFGST
jgi:hypothetical protein